jgi:hypothetical protein
VVEDEGTGVPARPVDFLGGGEIKSSSSSLRFLDDELNDSGAWWRVRRVVLLGDLRTIIARLSMVAGFWAAAGVFVTVRLSLAVAFCGACEEDVS